MTKIMELLNKQTKNDFYGDGEMIVTDLYGEEAHLEFVNDLMLETKAVIDQAHQKRAQHDYHQRINRHEEDISDVPEDKRQYLAGLYKAKYSTHTLLGLVRFIKNNKSKTLTQINEEFNALGNFREFYNNVLK
tara:strand:- start:82 stop:480 length:399 start_codon:yes stop_codon:yes gene_type:complete